MTVGGVRGGVYNVDSFLGGNLLKQPVFGPNPLIFLSSLLTAGGQVVEVDAPTYN